MKKILIAIVLVCPLAIWAQEIKPIDVRPGLWENTTVTELSGLPATANMPTLTPDQLAKLPPAQRAQMEAMMKGGIGAPRTNTTKACVTKEQLSKPLFENGEKGCTYKLTNSSSSNQTVHVECARGNTKSAGDLSFDRQDAEHVKGNMVLKTSGDSSTNAAASNVTIKISFTEKWLAADCGDVKPNGDK